MDWHPFYINGSVVFDGWTGKKISFLRLADYDPEKGGPNYRRLMKQPGKKLMTPEGQAFLEYIRSRGEEIDPLVPWLANQFKKGELTLLHGNLRTLGSFLNTDVAVPENVWISDQELSDWANWYNAKDHPTRQGVNVEDKSFGVYEMRQKVREHQEALREEKFIKDFAEKDTPIEKTLNNGWTIRRLRPQDLSDESKVLGHCIGTDEKYCYWLEQGNIEVYSLRDENGIPKLTWHYNDDGTLAHIQGSSGALDGGDQFDPATGENDKNVKPEYLQMAFQDPTGGGVTRLVTVNGEHEYDEEEEEEEEAEPEELDEYTENIEDVYSLISYLETDDPLERVQQEAELYCEDSSAGWDNHPGYYVGNGTNFDIYIYWPSIVSELISYEIVFEEDPLQVDGGEQRQLFAPENKGRRRPYINRDAENADALLSAFDTAIRNHWQFDHYIDAGTLLGDFTYALGRYKAQGRQEQEAVNRIQEKINDFALGYTLPGEDEPTWENYNRFEDWIADPSNSPTLWQEGTVDSPYADVLQQAGPYRKPGELKDPQRATPWWDPIIDPSASPSSKIDAEKGYVAPAPNLFAQASHSPKGIWNHVATFKVSREEAYDLWTGKRIGGIQVSNIQDAGQNLRRIMKQPGKALMTPEGEAFIDELTYAGEDIDPLTPWLVSQFKKGAFSYDENTGVWSVNEIGDYGPFRLDDQLPKWAQWFNAKDHPTRRGLNIQEMSIDDVSAASTAFAKAMEKEEERRRDMELVKDSTAEIIHQFPNGFTVRHLTEPEHLKEETAVLRHCIGDNEQPYCKALENEEIDSFSLRDPDGIPKATWHYNNEDGSLAQIKGRSGLPKEEYMDMFREWSELNDKPTKESGDAQYEGAALEEVRVPIENLEEFIYAYGEDSGIQELAWSWIEGTDGNIGENTEIFGDLMLDDIVEELVEKGLPNRTDMNDFFQALINSDLQSPIEKFETELASADRDGAYYGEVVKWFENLKEEYTDPNDPLAGPKWNEVWNDKTPLQVHKDKNWPQLWEEATSPIDATYERPQWGRRADPETGEVGYGQWWEEAQGTINAPASVPWWSEEHSFGQYDDDQTAWSEVLNPTAKPDVMSPTGWATNQDRLDRINPNNTVLRNIKALR